MAPEEMSQEIPAGESPHPLTPQEQIMAKLISLREAQKRKAAHLAQQKAQQAAAQQAPKQPKPQAPQAATKKEEREESHELLRDFTAEKAILYSEIMKPKYLDYE